MLIVETSFTNEFLVSSRDCLLSYGLINYRQDCCHWPTLLTCQPNNLPVISCDSEGGMLHGELRSYCCPCVVNLDMASSTRQSAYTCVGLFMSSKSFSQEKFTSCCQAVNSSVILSVDSRCVFRSQKLPVCYNV